MRIRRGKRGSPRRKSVCECVCVYVCMCAFVGAGIISCVSLRVYMAAPLCDFVSFSHSHRHTHTYTHSYKPQLGSGPYAMILFFALEVKRGSTKFHYSKKEIGMCVCVCVCVCVCELIPYIHTHTHTVRGTQTYTHAIHPPFIHTH